MITLRDYQEEALEGLQGALGRGVTRPLIIAPTGSGKSVMLAVAIKRWMGAAPHRKFLVLTHTKELVKQDYDAICKVIDPKDVGIYSAGLWRKDTTQRVIVGGIQSVAKHRGALAGFSVVFIDEAHRLPRSGWGQYRSTLESEEFPLGTEYVVGWTATGFRMDGGMLTDGDDAPFEEVAYDIPIQRLMDLGHLARLRAVDPRVEFETSKLTIRAGEFANDARFLEAVSDEELLEKIVDGWLMRAKKADGTLRKTLVFCASIRQMELVHGMIAERGVACATISGETRDSDDEEGDPLFGDRHHPLDHVFETITQPSVPETRTGIINAFKAGRLTALLNCNVLTTGFDAPDVECILCLRPTASPVLYVQMMGRGTRTAPGKVDCLVLDHGGNVARHGTIDRVHVPRKGAPSDGLTVRAVTCKGCETLYAVQEPACPVCGLVRDVPVRRIAGGLTGTPSFDELLESGKAKRYDVLGTTYVAHTSAKSGDLSVRIMHRLKGKSNQVSEFFSFDSQHPFARKKAGETWMQRFPGAPATPGSAMEALDMLRDAPIHVWPTQVIVQKEGEWDRVIGWLHAPKSGPVLPDITIASDPEAASFGFSPAFDKFNKAISEQRTKPGYAHRHGDELEAAFWRDITLEETPF